MRRGLLGGVAATGLGAAAVAQAGPALAPVLPPVGRSLGVVLRQEGLDGVAIAFDEGPHPQGTPAALETLRDHGARATFFLAGEQVERWPALAAEIVAAGHRVELHCHRHRNQLRLSRGDPIEDAERGRAAIEEASGQAIADYRAPYGIFSAAGLRAVRARGWRRCCGRSGGGTGGAARRPTRSRARRPPAPGRATSSYCTMPITTARRAPGSAPPPPCRSSSRSWGGGG